MQIKRNIGKNEGPYSNYTNLHSVTVPYTKQNSFKKLKTNQNHNKIIKVEGGTVSDYSQDATAKTTKNFSIKNMIVIKDSIKQLPEGSNPSPGEGGAI